MTGSAKAGAIGGLGLSKAHRRVSLAPPTGTDRGQRFRARFAGRAPKNSRCFHRPTLLGRG